MIRILQMIGSLEMGGSQSMIMNIYRNIDREKIQFDFIVDHTDNMFFAEEITSLGGKIYIMPSFKGVNIISIYKEWDLFFKCHPEYKVLHSHVRSYASIYMVIAKKHGVETIIHSHSTSNGTGIKAIVKAILQYPLRFQADYLVACSENSGKWLFGEKACERENYMIIPNAIDINKFRYNEEVRDLYRKEYGFENKYVIGHVGRFHESKNHKFLLDVFKEVYEKRNDSVLVLVGEGELRQEIEEKIHEMEMDETVFLLGNRKDIYNIYQMMDVFVFPSLWEGLPVTVVEAQAAGLHCIISSNITDEVILTSSVIKLPVDGGIDEWVKNLLEIPDERNDNLSLLEDSKYNIVTSINVLQKFYTDIVTQCK